MENWDKRVRDNLHGSAYLRTWEEMPYALKSAIAESIMQGNGVLPCVGNRLLAEKIILALDDYGRKVHPVEYGLPIDPDTKDFEDKRPQEMLKIVTDILNDF